jgi:prephenate dehydrogenase
MLASADMGKSWNSVAIVGVGLIGGSIGLALRERKLADQIIGIGRRTNSLEKACALGCVTEITTNLAEGVLEAQLAVVCTPVERIALHVAEIAAHCPPDCLITDAGSTKGQIVASVPAKARFVGSHPIAGSEKSGPEAACADLFNDRVVVVTPTAYSDPAAVSAIESFWQSLGARIVRMTPDEHDAALALTSHLPHLVASALAMTTPESVLPLTGPGWQDTTRVASGDAELWRQIFLANQVHTLKALDDFATVLERFRAALKSGDGTLLAALLAEGKRRRDALGS